MRLVTFDIPTGARQTFSDSYLWICQLQAILHRGGVLDPHKIVVPTSQVRNHIESHEPVTQQHLSTLIMCRQVSLWIPSDILVLPSPFISSRGQLVCRQGTGSRCKTACDQDTTLAIPLIEHLEELCMVCYILDTPVQTLRHQIDGRFSLHLFASRGKCA